MDIHPIPAGGIALDGGGLFGLIPRPKWILWETVRRDNTVPLPVISFLLKSPDGQFILINTGVRTEWSSEDGANANGLQIETSHLFNRLKEAGVQRQDIGTVILTSLRVLDAGGCVAKDRRGRLSLAFPNATYVLQADAIEEARNPYGEVKTWYSQELLETLLDSGKLRLVRGNETITKGIEVRQTEGPSLGHQIVVARIGGDIYIHPGNLIPTMHHVDPACIPAFHRNSEQSRNNKRELFEEAARTGALLLFPWGAPRKQAAYVSIHTTGGYSLRLTSLGVPPHPVALSS